MKNIPIIVDTDPGIDDFFAIMLANSHDQFDIKAITTVAGNQVLEKTTENALKIAELFKMKARIAKGAEGPINCELRTAGNIHGNNGLGDVMLPDTTRKLDKDYAWDVIYQEAVKSEGKLQLIAIGPLTNVAIALLKYSDLHKYIDKIVIMGGSTESGNRDAYGEFNIWVDPIAADIVFKSGIPLTMVGLNVTMKAGIIPQQLDELLSVTCKFDTQIRQLFTFLQKSYAQVGYSFIAIHDALAIAYVMQQEVLKCKPYYVAVETRGRHSRGRTVVDLDRSHKTKALNAHVAIDVDKEMFIKILKDMLKYYN